MRRTPGGDRRLVRFRRDAVRAVALPVREPGDGASGTSPPTSSARAWTRRAAGSTRCMAISTLLGRGPAYRNVVVNDLVLDAEGQKMSKSRGNVVDPWEAIGGVRRGRHPLVPAGQLAPVAAEAVRPRRACARCSGRCSTRCAARTASSRCTRTSRTGRRPRGDPAVGRAPADRPLAALAARPASTSGWSADLEAYNLTHAVRELGDFIVDDLSNWYVRRSRDRFWGSARRGGHPRGVRHAAPGAGGRVAADGAVRALPGGLAAPRAAGRGERAPGAASRSRVPICATRSWSGGWMPCGALSTLGRAAREQVRIRVRQPLGTLYAVVPPRSGHGRASCWRSCATS